MTAEFNVWLLLVGLFAGAAIVWLAVGELGRRDAEINDAETAREARWIEAVLEDEGRAVEPGTAASVLRLHRDYLAAPPPDGPDDLAAAALPDATEPSPVAESATPPAAADVPAAGTAPRPVAPDVVVRAEEDQAREG